MSGHSKWATTHRQKEASDAKKGAVFTKLANLITVAAREGGDPEANFKLRLALEKARTANMPKDNIQRAVDKGTGASREGETFEEVTYEIIGPANTGFIVEAVTNNKNRTVAEIKSILNKNNGQLGSTNSVAWNFLRRGVILAANTKLSEEIELILIDAGAEDIKQSESDLEIITAPENLRALTDQLKEQGLVVKEAGLAYLPKEEINLSRPEDQASIERFYDLLTGLDDVTNVYTNATW